MKNFVINGVALHPSLKLDTQLDDPCYSYLNFCMDHISSSKHQRNIVLPSLWICVLEVVGLHFGAHTCFGGEGEIYVEARCTHSCGFVHFVTHTCFGGEGESYVEARSIHFHQFLTLPRYYYSRLKPAVPCSGDACVLLLLFALLVQLCCDVFCRVA